MRGDGVRIFQRFPLTRLAVTHVPANSAADIVSASAEGGILWVWVFFDKDLPHKMFDVHCVHGRADATAFLGLRYLGAIVATIPAQSHSIEQETYHVAVDPRGA